MKKILDVKKDNQMFLLYFFKMVFRVTLFVVILYSYIFYREYLDMFIYFRLFDRFTLLHVLWLILMLTMISHLFPTSRLTMGVKKCFAQTYVKPKNNYDRNKLLEYVQGMNIKAWQVMLVWLAFNAVFAVLYLYGIIGEAELILLSMFYNASDIICMIIYCPFQKNIMGNRCCINCRIFDWGCFMMYTPLVFIKSFFTWSLFFTSCIVLLNWETKYAKYPERFWSGSNAAIRCENCRDKLCKIKKPLNTAENQ